MVKTKEQIREEARIRSLRKVLYFYPRLRLHGIGKELWHVFKEPRICEICGNPLKRGYYRPFSYTYEGKRYVAGEVAHKRCVIKLTNYLINVRSRLGDKKFREYVENMVIS